MSDESMVERVAAAVGSMPLPPRDLRTLLVQIYGYVEPDLSPEAREQRVTMILEFASRCAIEVMREPTEAMRTAAGPLTITNDTSLIGIEIDGTHVWRAMIDAALKP